MAWREKCNIRTLLPYIAIAVTTLGLFSIKDKKLRDRAYINILIGTAIGVSAFAVGRALLGVERFGTKIMKGQLIVGTDVSHGEGMKVIEDDNGSLALSRKDAATLTLQLTGQQLIILNKDGKKLGYSHKTHNFVFMDPSLSEKNFIFYTSHDTKQRANAYLAWDTTWFISRRGDKLVATNKKETSFKFHQNTSHEAEETHSLPQEQKPRVPHEDEDDDGPRRGTSSEQVKKDENNFEISGCKVTGCSITAN